MKRVFLIISLLFFIQFGFAQWRYFSVKLGLVNNYIPIAKDNKYVLYHSQLGDLTTHAVNFINYTPGMTFGVLYHMDSHKGTFGWVIGLQVQNYGITQNYKTDIGNFKVYEQFRFTSLVIPFFLKFNNTDIYINQTYYTIGFKFYYNFLVNDIQIATGGGTPYFGRLTSGMYNKSSFALMGGLNVGVFYLDLDYQLKTVLSPKHEIITDEGIVLPYQNLDFQSRIYFTLGIHIPLTRWITVRSWTAEKIRRMLSPVR